MNNDKIFSDLVTLFKDVTLLEPKEFTNEQSLNGLIDSMTRIELMTDIEDHFGLDIENEDLVGIETFGDIVDLVTERLVPTEDA